MSAAPAQSATATGLSRWITYQRERFPVIAHGLLILAFSSGAVSFAAQLRAAHGIGRPFPAPASLLVAFVSCFLFFFQLRVSDEFKDFDDDARWRPYRPVPRGLVTLGELRTLALAGAAIQLVLALWLSPRLIVPLLLVWGYMALMTKEFWLHDWLRTRPLTVLWTHMLIMPFIDLYATTCDWLAKAEGHKSIGAGLAWFLAASFFNGMVVEIGRKIRAPEDEERGVDTYSAVWGRRRAVIAWLGVMVVTLAAATLAARAIDAVGIVGPVLGVLLLVAAVEGARIARAPHRGQGKRIELLAGLWTIAMYLSVGVIPLFTR